MADAPKVSELQTEIESQRIILGLGFVPSELLGASNDEWRERLMTYKVIVDWIRSKNWALTSEQRAMMETAVRERLPNYTSVMEAKTEETA